MADMVDQELSELLEMVKKANEHDVTAFLIAARGIAAGKTEDECLAQANAYLVANGRPTVKLPVDRQTA